MSNWIDSGGDAPPICTDDNWKNSDRRHARRLKAPLTIGIVVLLCTLGTHLGHAHDPSHPELKAWFESLRSGKGPCCSTPTARGQRRRLAIRQWPLSRSARWRMDRCPRRSRDIRTEPGRPNHGVAVARLYGHDHPLLHARQHDLKRDDAASKGRTRTTDAPFSYEYFLSRSSSSIEMPCGPRMKQMRMPGRMVVGSFVNSTPLALISAATASMSFTVNPK